MQSEIQWLVEMMMSHKLPVPVKDRFIARIGEVEKNLTSAPRTVSNNPPQGMFSYTTTTTPVQAPSTQRLLDEHPLVVPMRAPTPPAAIDKETGRAIVSTGNGTKGPRKF